MHPAPRPLNEPQRLAHLRSYGVLDTLPQKAFEDITALASSICGTPMALISLVDENRQWFKSKLGLQASETSREVAFCAHAILNPSEVFVVEDATSDLRFANNPLVEGDPGIRFYAGAPIVSQDGFALGTVCVIDTQARRLTPAQEAALRSLSGLVTSLMEHEKQNQEIVQMRTAQAASDNEILNAMVTEGLDLKSFVDPHYTYRYVNPIYLDYWGRQPQEIIGRSIAELLGREVFEQTVQHRIDQALAGTAAHYEATWDFPIKGKRHVEVSYLPAHGPSGNIIGVVVRARDVQQRKERDDQIRQTVALLEHKTLEQDRFIHIISHDLREPINTINNFTSLLTEDGALNLPAHAQRYLDFVAAGGQRMATLLDDLMHFLQLDRHAIEKRPVDLAGIASQVRDDLGAALQRSRGRMTYGHLPMAFGDPSLLRIALQNLVANGLKFVAKDTVPCVELAFRADGDTLHIDVRDNGIGMKAEEMGKIFDLFKRLHSSKAYPGSGLGLSICRRVAELHGGAMSVTSAPGAGTCFTLSIPAGCSDQERFGHVPV